MNKELIFAICFISLLSCSSSPTSEETSLNQMIPDRTPYISGLVEATNDTVHHFPEVVVGYMSDVVWDTDNWEHPDILRNYPHLYNPTLWTQVVKTSQAFGFGYQSETEAKVTITGPIDHPKQREVRFSSLGNGVYGDQEYELGQLAGEEYKLRVKLPDKRIYIAHTIIPEKVTITVPDSIGMKVKYDPYADGTPREESNKRYPIIHSYPDHEFLTVRQWNSSIDRELWLLEPGEKFPFSDRSPYLRGGFYGISMSSQSKDTLGLKWGQDLNKNKENIWNKVTYWLRFSFFSEGIGHMFHSPYTYYSLDGNEYEPKINRPFAQNLSERDTTYLFETSTLQKLDGNDNVLPKDSLDAIGFFGGYYSVYQKTTVYPDRTFDLDTVLTKTQ